MTQRTEERFGPQLLQLELAVIQAYEDHPELPDAQVDSAYEELARRYRAEATNFEFKPGKLDGLRQTVHDALLPVAEMLRGRPKDLAGAPVIEAEDVRVCFNRLRSSIKTWSKLGRGRQGYLDYISEAVEGEDFDREED